MEAYIWQQLGREDIVKVAQRHRLQRYGRVLRNDDDWVKILQWRSIREPDSRPRKTWKE